MDYGQLGQKVKQLRLRNQWTQEKVAEICNISPSYVGLIERGTKKISIETLVKIATAFDVSVDSLLFDSEQLSEDVRIKQLLTMTSNLSSNDIEFLIDIMNRIAVYIKR